MNQNRVQDLYQVGKVKKGENVIGYGEIVSKTSVVTSVEVLELVRIGNK